jgi:hypothetical protein
MRIPSAITNLFRRNFCQECPYAKQEAKLERRKIHARQNTALSNIALRKTFALSLSDRSIARFKNALNEKILNTEAFEMVGTLMSLPSIAWMESFNNFSLLPLIVS